MQICELLPARARGTVVISLASVVNKKRSTMPDKRLIRHIDAPTEQVFSAFTDRLRAAERIQGMESLEMLAQQPVATGTRNMFGGLASEQLTVSGFTPNQSYRVECDSQGTHYDTQFSFMPSETGTIVDMRFSARPKSLSAKLLKPLSRIKEGNLVKSLEHDIDDLQRYCESRRASFGTQFRKHH